MTEQKIYTYADKMKDLVNEGNLVHLIGNNFGCQVCKYLFGRRMCLDERDCYAVLNEALAMDARKPISPKDIYSEEAYQAYIDAKRKGFAKTEEETPTELRQGDDWEDLVASKRRMEEQTKK